MRLSFKEIRHVFTFTLTQQFRSKGYRIVTVIFAALCLLLPAVILPAVEFFKKDETPVTRTDISTVYTVDLSGTGETSALAEAGLSDASVFNSAGDAVYSNINYIACPDLETAQALIAEEPHYPESAQAYDEPHSLILVLEKEDTQYRIHLLHTEESGVSKEDRDAYETFINENFYLLLLAKSGLDTTQLAGIYTPVYPEIVRSDAPTGMVPEEEMAEEDPFASLRQVLSFLLPYVNGLLLYFLILYYGQNVANIVIMEKTSKLMDTFLVTVKPGAMIFGKVLAVVLSSILQFSLWVVALIGGFAAGTHFVYAINPNTDMLLIRFFEMIGDLTGMFSLPGALIALCMVFGGFLLYCALASIGGALAGKPEDLSSTNMLYTLILVISFFCALGSGAMTGEMGEAVTWLDFVPFTSIMITPGRLLLGYLSPLQGLFSLLILLITAAVIMLFAGRLYRMMSLYKGNPPTPKMLIAMLKDSKNQKEEREIG